MVERGVIIEYLALFKEYNALAIPIVVVLVIFKTEIITDLQADSIQKILWSKSKRLQVDIGRFIMISILSAILIALIGCITKDWWSCIYICVKWLNIIFFFITCIIMIVQDLFGWIPNKLIDFIEGHPQVISVIFSVYFILTAYMFGYILFNKVLEFVKNMNIDKTSLILLGTIIYGTLVAMQLMIFGKVIFRKKKLYKILWNEKEYNIICVTSDKMIHIKELDGSEYRVVEKEILKECIFIEK